MYRIPAKLLSIMEPCPTAKKLKLAGLRPKKAIDLWVEEWRKQSRKHGTPLSYSNAKLRYDALYDALAFLQVNVHRYLGYEAEIHWSRVLGKFWSSETILSVEELERQVIRLARIMIKAYRNIIEVHCGV